MEDAILEGSIAVLAALRSGNREIIEIAVSNDRSSTECSQVLRAASAAGVRVERPERRKIDELASGTRHGGVIAIVGPRKFVQMADLLTEGRSAFIAMIDGVEDPYNFGSAVRSLYAAGAQGLVVRPRNWMSAAGIVGRSSAGASELRPTAVADTALAAAEFFEQKGLTVACAGIEQATSIHDADLTIPLFLLIGGEQRGVTRSFLRRASLRLRIPYARTDAHALGTAAATAIIAFEVARQRAVLLRRPRIS